MNAVAQISTGISAAILVAVLPGGVPDRGIEVLRLVVRSADGNTSHNHTSWADAFLLVRTT